MEIVLPYGLPPKLILKLILPVSKNLGIKGDMSLIFSELIGSIIERLAKL